MFKNILIPTDGSELSQRAVHMAVALAKLHEARLTGIHVIPDYHLLIAYEGAFDPVTEERIEEEAKARAQNYLDFVRKSAQDAGVPCETVCETSDHPYDAILKAADARHCPWPQGACRGIAWQRDPQGSHPHPHPGLGRALGDDHNPLLWMSIACDVHNMTHSSSKRLHSAREARII